MYTGQELMDAIITEMYELFKALISGNYTAFCTLFADIMSRLAALRKGMKDDAEAKAKQIESLRAQLERATTPAQPAPGGEIIGGQTTTIDLTNNDGVK